MLHMLSWDILEKGYLYYYLGFLSARPIKI